MERQRHLHDHVLTERSARSTPTGPGSRGGHWHEPGFPAAYMRVWRAAHPEYRERERLRRARQRHGDDVAQWEAPSHHPAVCCSCTCDCRAEVVTICGFCRDGLHKE